MLFLEQELIFCSLVTIISKGRRQENRRMKPKKQILLQLLSLSELNLWNVEAWKHQGFNLGPPRDILARNVQEFEYF